MRGRVEERSGTGTSEDFLPSHRRLSPSKKRDLHELLIDRREITRHNNLHTAGSGRYLTSVVTINSQPPIDAMTSGKRLRGFGYVVTGSG